MRFDAAELHMASLPLRRPFVAAHGAISQRDAVFVRLLAESADGWGECVAPTAPGYTHEHAAGALRVLREGLLPALLGAEVSADTVGDRWDGVSGHHMAKAAVEMAVLDAELRSNGESLAHRLGCRRSQVEAGAAVGITPSVTQLVDEVEQLVVSGYRRVKVKVRPGWDVEPVSALRERFPDLGLQVDANGAYRSGFDEHETALAALDGMGLVLIEQPLGPSDLAGHARLVSRMATPVCLDETITSLDSARQALDAGACSIVCVKPGSVGGWLEARRIHDLCQERGVPAWCGGMHETSLGRSALAGLAGLPGFTVTGDLSAPATYLEVDVVADPLEVRGGWVGVPTSPGIGATVDPGELAAVTVGHEQVRA